MLLNFVFDGRIFTDPGIEMSGTVVITLDEITNSHEALLTTEATNKTTLNSPASFFNGNISEVIIYSTIVSSSDYSNLQKYLINKWNIQ
jgi:hypothetical protein